MNTFSGSDVYLITHRCQYLQTSFLMLQNHHLQHHLLLSSFCSIANGQKHVLEYCLRASGYYNCDADSSLAVYHKTVVQNLNGACPVPNHSKAIRKTANFTTAEANEHF